MKIILSGYPLQNNLCELYSMLYFVSPRITTLLFGSLKRFEHVFVKKIRFWQISTKQEEREKAKKWSCVLRHALESSSLFLRRSISIISAGLPPKTEFILRVGLDPKQRDLYIRYLCRLMDESSENPSVFRAFSLLSMVCDHPFIPKKMHLDKGSEPNSVLKYTLSRTWISEEYDFLFQKALGKNFCSIFQKQI